MEKFVAKNTIDPKKSIRARPSSINRESIGESSEQQLQGTSRAFDYEKKRPGIGGKESKKEDLRTPQRNHAPKSLNKAATATKASNFTLFRKQANSNCENCNSDNEKKEQRRREIYALNRLLKVLESRKELV